MLQVCVFHTDSVHGFQEIYQINPLFIHLINYKAKAKLFYFKLCDAVLLFSISVYKKKNVSMYV